VADSGTYPSTAAVTELALMAHSGRSNHFLMLLVRGGPPTGVKAHVVSRRRPTSRHPSTVVNSRRRGVAVVKAQLQDTDALSRRSAGLMATALTLVEAMPVWGMPLPAMAAGERSFYDFTVMRGGEPFALVSPGGIGCMWRNACGDSAPRSGSAVWLCAWRSSWR
jgi:hypothetical protein